MFVTVTRSLGNQLTLEFMQWMSAPMRWRKIYWQD